ncbi:hypothetical protein [uncultured Brevibacillus sp.]|uniref:hypothetical protein n=1 Tax=uncultured Brevibacillus sp. TaxID=169970 RepID=UPI002592D911|nr:hypothetical protein [uncultured Brevibacillus sp.]
MVYCPFCDGQGLMNEATVVNHDLTIFICDECDTMWESSDIKEENSKNFKEYMDRFRYKGLWSELTNIKRI